MVEFVEKGYKMDKPMTTEDHSEEIKMRETKVPIPKTLEELGAYVNELVDRKHDYGTCVYAISMAAVAAYEYVAHKLGVTGRQASCADLDIVRRTRGWEMGFALVNYADAMYPQYWDEIRGPIFASVIDKNSEQFMAKAKELIAQSSDHADERVIEHWTLLAEGRHPRR